MSVLPDHHIREWCIGSNAWSNGAGLITPYNPYQVQPASYDVKLGKYFRVFNPSEIHGIDLADPETYKSISKPVRIEKGNPFVLHAGEFALGTTEEVVNLPANIAGRIEGKSSLGRLGLIVHATAGYLDPGFTGTVTLEMTNLQRIPITLRPGLEIAQLSFQYLEASCENPYEGRYQGDTDAAASRYGLNKKDWGK